MPRLYQWNSIKVPYQYGSSVLVWYLVVAIIGTELVYFTGLVSYWYMPLFTVTFTWASSMGRVSSVSIWKSFHVSIHLFTLTRLLPWYKRRPLKSNLINQTQTLADVQKGIQFS